MSSDAALLRRARLIERVRAVEHRRAAGEAHHAEATRRKLTELVERTRALAEAYATDGMSGNGADLIRAVVLGARLHDLGRNAARQAEPARREADDKLALLATAERRLQSAGEKRHVLERADAARRARPDNVPQRAPTLNEARNKTGTEVE